MEIVLITAGESLPETDTTVMGCYQDPVALEPFIILKGAKTVDENLTALLKQRFYR
ncbi:MAG: hypothetical protein U5P10_13450 [Spirochaetia bacterium]|nr:hypothetical protein [Spirochaetia bacterium]